jgi:hypothetical protein
LGQTAAGTGLSKEQKAALSEQLAKNKEVQGVIIGMLLGDACLRIHGNDAHMLFEHQSFSLLLWKLYSAIGVVGAEVRKSSHFDKRTGKTTFAYAFATFTLPFFTGLFHQWYVTIDGKIMKIIPGNIAELLTPVALAFWCASDATFNRGAVVLCTDSFTAAEVDILRSILLTKYGINSTRVSNGTGKEQYRIRIAKSSMPTLQALVSDHIPQSMRYRVGL